MTTEFLSIAFSDLNINGLSAAHVDGRLYARMSGDFNETDLLLILQTLQKSMLSQDRFVLVNESEIKSVSDIEGLHRALITQFGEVDNVRTKADGSTVTVKRPAIMSCDCRSEYPGKVIVKIAPEFKGDLDQVVEKTKTLDAEQPPPPPANDILIQLEDLEARKLLAQRLFDEGVEEAQDRITQIEAKKTQLKALLAASKAAESA